MFRRPNRILLAAGVAVAVIAAMAGPASARTAAGAQATTPVPVDVTGDMTWTFVYTPLGQGQSGSDTQTVTFHIGLTGLDPASGQVTGNTSTYSLTDDLNETTIDSDNCKIQVTGSFSGSGPVAMNGASGPAYGSVVFGSGLTQAQLGVHISYAQTQTATFSGPAPLCNNSTSTSTEDLQANPGCYTPTGPLNPGGPLQGTYPNATVNLGCSATAGNQLWREDTTITGTLTITPSCGGATASSQTSASSASLVSARSAASISAPSNGSCPNHYTVTVEDWIPQSSVVDPVMPVPIPYLLTRSPSASLLDPNCLQPPLPAGLNRSVVRSSYQGDGHAGFGGSYRVKFGIAFDFDGESITNFQIIPPKIGTTIRNKTYTANGKVVASCFASGVAKFQGGAEQTADTSFTINSGGANPLSPPGTPSFSIAVSGSLHENGDLELSMHLTDFPSGGIQVTENGQDVLTDVANDVSCLSPSEVTGLRGVITLAEGLLRTHDLDLTAYANSSQSESDPSPLC